jgi:hypothetical protein
MTWRRRKGTDAAAERARVRAEVAEREAVRVAEQMVSSAWVAQLLRTEQNARDTVRAYTHMRAEALSALQEAQLAGQPHLIAQRQSEVEDLDAALSNSATYCDAVASTVGSELDKWSSATRTRVAERLTDRGRLREVGAGRGDLDLDALAEPGPAGDEDEGF